MMDLSIIIVSWNVKELLKKCLRSILTQTQNISYEIIVIDNASIDGTADMIKREFPEVKLVINDRNLGFAAANNQGIKLAQGEILILLNPDTEIVDNALSEMVGYLKKHLKIGILGPKLLNSDKTLQPSIRRFPNLLDQLLILTKLPNFFPKLIAKYTAQDLDYQKSQVVEQVMGAALMTRREVINKIGNLDENFKLWFNEIDWCLRSIKTGWQNHYLAQAEIIHYKGQSFSQLQAIKKQYEWNKNLLYYFAKHKPRWQWLVLLLAWPFSLILATIQQLLSVKQKKPKYL
jgi:N-acetylglucosaminyl-diphospho-decaprenol L-rhamnosyltransferase